MMLKDIEWETCEHLAFNKRNENYSETVGYCCWDERGPRCSVHNRNCIWLHLPKVLLINDAVRKEPGVIYMDIAPTDEIIKGSNPRSAPLFEHFEYIPFTIRNDLRSRGKAGTYYERRDYDKPWYIWLPPDVLEGKIVPGEISVRLGIPHSTNNTKNKN